MKKYGLFLGLAIGVTLLFTQCSPDEDVNPQNSFRVDQNGYSTINRDRLRNELNQLPKEPIS